MKLEIGKQYGSITGPITANLDEAYPFKDESRSLVYTATGKRPQGVNRCYEITRPLAERLPAAGKVVMTATQSALKRQIEREAMETAHETKRTPRQLADERAELIAALRRISEQMRCPDEMADYARNTLARLNP